MCRFECKRYHVEDQYLQCAAPAWVYRQSSKYSSLCFSVTCRPFLSSQFSFPRQAIAKIETDKASIDFEAQDDAYVAKILVEAGNGNDIKCGTPILITVDDEADIAAFNDYVLPTASDEPSAAPADTPPAAKVDEPVKAAAPTPVAPEPAQVAAAPSTPPTAPAATAAAPPAVSPLPAVRSASRQTINSHSALLKTLGRNQQAYIDRYGSTGQLPV